MESRTHKTSPRGRTNSSRTERTTGGLVPREPIRLAKAVLGGTLLVAGLRRRTLPGVGMALAGGWLLVRSLGGTDRIGRAVGSGADSAGEPTDRTGPEAGVAVSRTVTVGRSPEEAYEVWRDPDQFAEVMGHFAEVTPTGDDRFRWTVHGPRGRDVSWETRVVEEEPGEYLRWETPADAVVPNEGSVRFEPAPGDRGTQVTLSVSFDPPGGALGTAVLERLDLAPKALAGDTLHRFKSLVESGEIPTLEGNPSGRGRGDLL